MRGNKYSNDKQQQQVLNVGTEVSQDSENTNISQIPDIYFVNDFFIQKTWEFLVQKNKCI